MDIITETKEYESKAFKVLHELWDNGYDRQAERIEIYWRGEYKPVLTLPKSEAKELLDLLRDCLEAGKK